MDKKYLFPIVGAVIIIIAVIGGFYIYQSYKVSTVQTLLKESAQHNTVAMNDFGFMKNSSSSTSYATGIKYAQNTLNELNNTLKLDTEASKYADGPYKDYTTYDIMRVQTDIDQCELYIEALQSAEKNNLSGILSITNQVKQDSDTSQNYKNKRDEVVAANPETFTFLNN